MTIFGGNNCFSGFYNDVWVLSNANGLGGTPSWTQLTPAGTPPSQSGYQAAVYDPGSNRLIVWGALQNPGTFSIDQHVWILTNANGVGGTPSWIQLAPAGPSIPDLGAQAAVYDALSNRMTVFGGGDSSGDHNDTWVLSNANGLGGTPTWTQLSPSGTLPAAREDPTAVYDPATNHMVIFAGVSFAPLTYYNDVWVLTNANGVGSGNTNPIVTPTIFWPTPADIVYGSPLSAAQLNATASAPGTLIYTAFAGTLLNAGSGQTLKVDFTPTDASKYTTASASVPINVLRAIPTVAVSGGTFTWDGNPQPATGAVTGVGGADLGVPTITYNGVAAIPVEPGLYTVNASFAGNLNYNPASASNTITIKKATPTISWSTPANLLHGYPLSATQLNATSSVLGGLLYTPTAGTILPIGTAMLSVDFTPTDTSHYNNASASLPLIVYNAPPSLTETAVALTVNEGSPATNGGTFADLNPTDNVILLASVGAVTKVGTNSGAWQWSYTPQDNASAATVTITGNDQNGGINSISFSLAVNNVQPTVTMTGPASGAIYPVGTPVIFTGTFTDPGVLDTHTAQWTFDAITAQGIVTESNGNGSASATYTFNTPGVYQVVLSVTDKDSGVGQASTVNGVFTALVIIYDPNGAFVTGGGWINSPAGAYSPDPSLSGKANFGFVSKYQKGAKIPTGETEFQFNVANVNFHSTAYEWLVIAGARAQYKGSGTINGAGDYGFLLTGIDGDVNGGGGVDKFRIKIWSKNSDGAQGSVIYDNQMGQLEDGGAATALGGGSIVIHQ